MCCGGLNYNLIRHPIFFASALLMLCHIVTCKSMHKNQGLIIRGKHLKKFKKKIGTGTSFYYKCPFKHWNMDSIYKNRLMQTFAPLFCGGTFSALTESS